MGAASTDDTLFDLAPILRQGPLPYGWRRRDDDVAYQTGSGHVGAFVTHGQRHAWVDEPLAPLILELWRADIDTVSCCQEDADGLAHVVLPGAGHVQWFLSLLAGDGLLPNRYRDLRRWHYEAWPYPIGVGEVLLFVKISFPLDDVADMVIRLATGRSDDSNSNSSPSESLVKNQGGY